MQWTGNAFRGHRELEMPVTGFEVPADWAIMLRKETLSRVPRAMRGLLF